MKTLPKSFTPSTNRIPVVIEGRNYELANMMKSGILHQQIFLVGDGEKWEQIKISDIGINYVNLQFISEIFEKRNFTFSDLGFQSNKKQDFTPPNPEDWYRYLNRLYPEHSISDLRALHDNLRMYNRKSPCEDLRGFLRRIQEKKLTINKYLKMEFQKLRENRLKSIGMKYNPFEDCYEGFGATVTGNQIETLSPEQFDNVIGAIERASGNEEKTTTEADIVQDTPDTETTKSRALSVSVIEGLQPEKIKEFKDLEKETAKLIKSNPVIEIKDKSTLELAKKHRAAMLKACTSIDGKDGLIATTKKAFNTAKTLFDKFLTSAAEPRRDHYNKLDEAVIAYEKAEEIRLAEEQRLKTEKLNQRRDELYAVPMTFNGTMYNIGTVYILPSQIENATDEEFAALIQSAKDMKLFLDKQAKEESDKDAVIRELQRKLAELTGEPAPVASEPQKTIEQVFDAVAAPSAPPAPIKPIKYQYITEYNLPDEKNNILHKFDMENADTISENPIPTGFIKARAFYIRGTQDVSSAIMDIMNAPDEPGVKKSALIIDLCNVILNQK